MASLPPSARQASKANDDLAVILAEETTGKVGTRGWGSCAIHWACRGLPGTARLSACFAAASGVCSAATRLECLQSWQPVLC